MQALLKPYLDKIKAWYLALSKREKVMVAVPIAGVVIFVLHSSIYLPLSSTLGKQKLQLEETTQNIKIVAAMIDKHEKLKARRAAIEEEYKEIEIKESGITLLEKMISKHLNLPSRSFDIRPSDPQAFGGNFEKTSYIIKFSTNELPKLVAFLEELVHGSAPMILKRLDLKVSGSNALDIEIDASSIRRVG